jgi:inner membrane protein
MPSAFTHAFVGAAMGQAAPPSVPRWRVALEIGLLAALPDLDVLGWRLGIPYADALGHRGASHSLVFAALVGVLYPTVLHRAVRPFTTTWWRLAGLAAAACASHALLDACTDAGLGVALFWPFSDARIVFPWRPIRTSPLNPAAFFSAAGVRILGNEILWVWTPVVAVLGVRKLASALGWAGRGA